ncbi:hypothetical protein DdX_14843 [Ditylenchus destructor]|uniref:Uncharacterized protein n=1 Tax=Ditylenchus destructor TaxID=166010 RepID=A0AAD4MQF6_9BILA|nr:hypothetical protein DdX_14843 [Ditylenchus destructor]
MVRSVFLADVFSFFNRRELFRVNYANKQISQVVENFPAAPYLVLPRLHYKWHPSNYTGSVTRLDDKTVEQLAADKFVRFKIVDLGFFAETASWQDISSDINKHTHLWENGALNIHWTDPEPHFEDVAKLILNCRVMELIGRNCLNGMANLLGGPCIELYLADTSDASTSPIPVQKIVEFLFKSDVKGRKRLVIEGAGMFRPEPFIELIATVKQDFMNATAPLDFSFGWSKMEGDMPTPFKISNKDIKQHLILGIDENRYVLCTTTRFEEPIQI